MYALPMLAGFTVISAAVRGRFLVQPLARRDRTCEPRISSHLGLCHSHACGGSCWVRVDDTDFEWANDQGHTSHYLRANGAGLRAFPL
jgi:hypothetical protein